MIKEKKTLANFDFQRALMIDRGRFSEVKRCYDTSSGADPKKKLCIKILDRATVDKIYKDSYIKREINLLLQLNHPNIVRQEYFFEDKKKYYIISEFVQNGNIAQFIHFRAKFLDEKLLFVFFFQMCLGIEYLHKKKIYHRNLNLTNVLLDYKSNLKLCDYAILEPAGRTIEMIPCASLDFIAPEVLMSRSTNDKADIWSLGAILYTLAYKKKPFAGNSMKEK